MTEAECASSKHIPATMEEYMSATSHSLVGAIIQSAAYLLGPRLPEEGRRRRGVRPAVEAHTILVSRLLNDVMTYERRSASRRVLLPSAAASPASVEAAKVEIGRAIYPGVEVGAAEAGVRRRRRGCSLVVQGDVLADE